MKDIIQTCIEKNLTLFSPVTSKRTLENYLMKNIGSNQTVVSNSDLEERKGLRSMLSYLHLTPGRQPHLLFFRI